MIIVEHATRQQSDTAPNRKNRKVLAGTVVSNNMRDTAVVAVTRYVKHPKYKKYVRRVKRYKVHDKGNTKQVGEHVRIQETRPISKTKRFVVAS